jgi:tetratricopeptide (TPR) repeat protein
MLSKAFDMEMEGLSQMISDEEMMNESFGRRIVFVQYIQDLYRFFKLSPFKNEFEDVFREKLDIYNSNFFKTLIDDRKIFRNIAEYFFEKGHFEEALDIFTSELAEDKGNIELLEKVGFCYQQMHEYKPAINYYKEIELIGKAGTWVLKNMGYCYRKIEDYENALKIYLEISEGNHEDIKIESLIGFCNLKLEFYETALKHYFKIEYLDPKNTAVIRPIAWCYFALGEFEKSDKYYKKVFELSPDYYDYVNYGHLKWATGDRRAAIENYILSTNYNNFNFTELQKIMAEDAPLILNRGIESEEVFLMMDYLRYRMK